MFWNHQHHLNNDIPINIHLYGHVHNSLEETIYQSFIQTLNQTYRYHCIAINVGCMMPYIHYQPKAAQALSVKIKVCANVHFSPPIHHFASPFCGQPSLFLKAVTLCHAPAELCHALHPLKGNEVH